MRGFRTGTGFSKRMRFLPMVHIGSLGSSGGLPPLTSTGSSGISTGSGTNSSSNLSSLTNQIAGTTNTPTSNIGQSIGQSAIQAAQGTNQLFNLGLTASNDSFIRDAAAKTYIQGLSNGASVLGDASNAKVG